MLHKTIAFVMALITKLLTKGEMFKLIVECQTAWEDIKNRYIQPPIIINPNWELEFHVYIDASRLVVVAILAQNPNT